MICTNRVRFPFDELLLNIDITAVFAYLGVYLRGSYDFRTLLSFDASVVYSKNFRNDAFPSIVAQAKKAHSAPIVHLILTRGFFFPNSERDSNLYGSFCLIQIPDLTDANLALDLHIRFLTLVDIDLKKHICSVNSQLHPSKVHQWVLLIKLLDLGLVGCREAIFLVQTMLQEMNA